MILSPGKGFMMLGAHVRRHGSFEDYVHRPVLMLAGQQQSPEFFTRMSKFRENDLSGGAGRLLLHK